MSAEHIIVCSIDLLCEFQADIFNVDSNISCTFVVWKLNRLSSARTFHGPSSQLCLTLIVNYIGQYTDTMNFIMVSSLCRSSPSRPCSLSQISKNVSYVVSHLIWTIFPDLHRTISLCRIPVLAAVYFLCNYFWSVARFSIISGGISITTGPITIFLKG